MRIALVTCRELPEPDPDEAPLLEALRGLGAEARILAWDDPREEPGSFDACVVRSTWNYYRQPGAFLEWIDRAERASRLMNPAGVIRWNAHKGYLRELERVGLAVTPTAWIERGARADLGAMMDERGWSEVVVKPCVSAASFMTRRMGRNEVDAAREFVEGLVRERDAMVQPYVRSVEGEGERSIVWIDGEATHAIRKNPRFSGEDESVSGALAVTDWERQMMERALGTRRERLLYARLDLFPGEDGRPMVSELELIEPSLFLIQHPPALERLARAIVGLAAG